MLTDRLYISCCSRSISLQALVSRTRVRMRSDLIYISCCSPSTSLQALVSRTRSPTLLRDTGGHAHSLTYIHAYMHTYICRSAYGIYHAHVHVLTHNIYTDTPTHKQTFVRAYIQHACCAVYSDTIYVIYTHSHIYTHTRTLPQMHAYTHMYIYIYTYTNACIYVCICIYVEC
jgi:hypothetical protein